ncbi:MAG: hypothetical protein KC621_24865, partial [Myxococcales bacterium]|nr:hypothetical protein [Myxococcales bacterium]
MRGGSMRLAGQMRLTTFLGVAGSGLLVAAILGFGGLGWWWSNRPEPVVVSEPMPIAAPVAPVAVPPPPPVPVAPAA